jgi:hypothetical protein
MFEDEIELTEILTVRAVQMKIVSLQKGPSTH